MNFNGHWLNLEAYARILGIEKPAQEFSGWLSSDDVNYAQIILNHQYPQSVAAKSPLHFEISPQGNSSRSERLKRLRRRKSKVLCSSNFKTQILMIGGNHWITVSNQPSTDETVVYVCDSLGLAQNNKDVSHEIAAVYRFEHKSFKIQLVDVENQKDGGSCGLFSLVSLKVVSRNSATGLSL